MLHRKSTILFLTFFLLFTITASARTYYVSSSSGSDSNSGTDASYPWKTVNKVNSFKSFAPGDYILFKRGDTFYGNITISNSGTSGSPITFSAYGSGNKPVITGFTTVSGWTNVGGNIWESSNPVSNLSSLNIVLVNGVNTAVGRYPNNGFLHFQSHNSVYSITSSSLSGSPNWTGANVVIRANRWTFDKKRITSQSAGTLYYSNGQTVPLNNFGFFIQDDRRTLDMPGEWYFNPSTRKLDIYSTSEPTSVQVSTVETLISSIRQNYITINNLDMRGANTTAVSVQISQHPTITKCDISFAGVFGMEITNSCAYADIENNNISDCGSSSIYSNDSGPYYTIKYNNINRSGLVSTILPHDFNGAAIFSPSNNALIQYNKIDSSADYGISFRGSNVQVRNNFINYSCLVRDDGGGIYTGFAGETGKVIDGNIVLNSIGNAAGTARTEIHASGIYVDDLGNNVTITNNSIANSSSAGIFLHNANNITVKNNTVFNSGAPGSFITGSLCLQADASSMVKGLNINNNIFFTENQNQLCLFYFSAADETDVKSFGVSDNNYFVDIFGKDPSVIIRPSRSNPGYLLNLSTWRTWSGKDANSKSSPKVISNTSDLRFEYNPSAQSKTIPLDAVYIDAKGNQFNGSITLAPFSSAVLIKSGASTNLLPAVYPSNPVNGVNYKYYEASDYSSLPDFNNENPVKSGNSNNFDLSLANRNSSYSFNFTGYVDVPSDGQYTFYANSDDGSKLYIDNVLVVNNDGLHAATEKSGSIGLKAGKHAISVGFFQQGGDQVLSVSYSGPGVSKQTIPNSSLYRSSNLLPAVYPSNTIQGLTYNYYESSAYSGIPDFNAGITPIKTGTSNTFDISNRNRSTAYSFNFKGYINVPADGQYTFYTTSDDGSNLYIDNVLVVDNNGLHAAIERSGTIGLKAGKHAISVGFFQQGGDQLLTVDYSGPGIAKQLIPSSVLFTNPSSSNLLPAVNPLNTVNGLEYKYYEAASYSALPDFKNITPVKSGTSNTFDISYRNRSTAYSFDFTGYINVPSDGVYTFYTTSDDGSNLNIDGVQVVDNNGLHAAEEQSGTIGLKAGKHTISVGFFQQDGDQLLEVEYSGPGISKQVIPNWSLFRNSSPSSLMVNSSSGMMFNNDGSNFQMERLLHSSQKTGVKVYPNPFRNSIQIDVNGATAAEFQLSLVDASGKTIWIKSVNDHTTNFHTIVNTSALPIGVYFLNLIQNGKQSTTKLLKEY